MGNAMRLCVADSIRSVLKSASTMYSLVAAVLLALVCASALFVQACVDACVRAQGRRQLAYIHVRKGSRNPMLASFKHRRQAIPASLFAPNVHTYTHLTTFRAHQDFGCVCNKC